ncbi:hypothetical protein CANINC_004742 [Pichia inconspicua]|uniref:Conserved oligomeric Golgi complex subunit 8 n=1 Tax=Pichia inconspicua TaxID=52247 RepID=A0A4T0WXL5_9ASCO|nr:hypothetical protein CANINC_004742 [[Candida] inconspicua]
MSELLLDRFRETGVLDITDDDTDYAIECLNDLLSHTDNSDTTDTSLFLMEQIAELSHANVQLDNKLAHVLTGNGTSVSSSSSPIQKVLSAMELVENTTSEWPRLTASAASIQPLQPSVTTIINSATSHSTSTSTNINSTGLTANALPPLLALVELPQLAHTLVTSGSQNKNSQYLASAVEVSALGQRVAAMHTGSILIEVVLEALERETTSLARHCCSLLQNGPASSLLQTVTALQRLLSASNNASTLPALFLRLRHQSIASEIDSLSPLRDSGLVELYGKRILEVLREQGFHTVATFHSLFTTNSNDSNMKHSLLINTFVKGLVQLVLPKLKELDSQSPTLLTQLTPQLLYCAESLARPGAAYSALLLQQLPQKPLIDAMLRQKTLQRSLNHH